MALAACLIVGVVSMVAGSYFAMRQERDLFLAQLRRGEVELDGWWFRVEAVEFPRQAQKPQMSQMNGE
jgi:hypothetical protein